MNAKEYLEKRRKFLVQRTLLCAKQEELRKKVDAVDRELSALDRFMLFSYDKS